MTHLTFDRFRWNVWLGGWWVALSLLGGCQDEARASVDLQSADLLARDSSSPEASPDTRILRDSPHEAPLTCDTMLSLQPLTLASTFCLAYRTPLPPAGTFSALAVQNRAFWTFISGGSPTWGQVKRGTVAESNNAVVALDSLFSFAPLSTEKLFANTFLARAPSGAVAVGYTYGQTFEGEILWGSSEADLQRIPQASGNYDAVFLDEQTLLVNSLGLGSAQHGQGIYVFQRGQPARRLIEEIGMLSGYLALSSQCLFAGGYFSAGNQVFGFTLDEIRAAVTQGKTLNATQAGDLIYSGNLLDATTLGEDLLVVEADDSWTFKAVQRLRVSLSGSTIIPQDVEELISSAGGSTQVLGIASHERQLGLLLQDGKTSELALVLEK